MFLLINCLDTISIKGFVFIYLFINLSIQYVWHLYSWPSYKGPDMDFLA